MTASLDDNLLESLATLESAREKLQDHFAAARIAMTEVKLAAQRSYCDVSFECIPLEMEATLAMGEDWALTKRTGTEPLGEPLRWFCESPSRELVHAQQLWQQTVADCLCVAKAQMSVMALVTHHR